MGGGGWHSVPTKEDFKAEIKSNIFIYVPIAGMLICLLTAFVAIVGTIFGYTVYCIWTDDFSSLGSFAYFLGKLLAMTIALFAWLIVMFIIKVIRAMWGKM